MSESAVAIVLESDPAKVADLFPQLLELCRTAGLDESAAFQLAAAVIEAVNNSIHHGYRDTPGHPIDIRWSCTADAVEIEIRDRGQPLPAGLLERNDMPQPDAESGRGWPIILEWTDAARYERIGNENVLNLRRRR